MSSRTPRRGSCTLGRGAREWTSSASTIAGCAPRGSRHVCFLARWPSRQGMQHARDRIREITDRRWLLRSVEKPCRRSTPSCAVGRATSATGTPPATSTRSATTRPAASRGFVAKRHKRTRGYGWSVLVFQSPDRLGLIDLNGTVVAPRPNRAWRGTLNAGGEERRRAVCGRTACTVRGGGGRKPDQSGQQPCGPGASRRPYRDPARRGGPPCRREQGWRSREHNRRSA